ncbi:MAG: DUF2240 family protein [Candidatus Methanoplasma sp.]|jgi:hypothetical protein|nr:DUF2240 family protein [Candidatus Methanoplasma sp.]
MTDELIICAAAFFRSKGKDVVTPKEFVMGVSLDLRWMPVVDAERLADVLTERKILVRNGEYLKPSVDLSGTEVPVAYRPSDAMLARLRSAPVGTKPKEILPDLVGAAVGSGMDRVRFISECNKVKKRLGIDMEAAALIILRDGGVDISRYIEPVRETIIGR